MKRRVGLLNNKMRVTSFLISTNIDDYSDSYSYSRLNYCQEIELCSLWWHIHAVDCSLRILFLCWEPQAVDWAAGLPSWADINVWLLCLALIVTFQNQFLWPAQSGAQTQCELSTWQAKSNCRIIHCLCAMSVTKSYPGFCLVTDNIWIVWARWEKTRDRVVRAVCCMSAKRRSASPSLYHQLSSGSLILSPSVQTPDFA